MHDIQNVSYALINSILQQQPRRQELTVVVENVLNVAKNNAEAAKKLNNCKNVEVKPNNLRLVNNNLGDKSSWSRRNAALQQEKKCRAEMSSFVEDQLIASPWFQAGLSR